MSRLSPPSPAASFVFGPQQSSGHCAAFTITQLAVETSTWPSVNASLKWMDLISKLHKPVSPQSTTHSNTTASNATPYLRRLESFRQRSEQDALKFITLPDLRVMQKWGFPTPQTKTHSNVSLFFPPRWNCWSSHSPTLNSNLWHTISLIQESASHVARGVRPFSHHVMTSQLTPQRSRLAQKSHCRGPRNSTETIYGGKNYDHAVSHVE